MDRSALMIMADGARADLLFSLLSDGLLPNIQRHIVDRGSALSASSVFPSTTGPAHLPFLTGSYPGPANVPGIRWFDRKRTRCGNPLPGLRSYCGVEAPRLDSDLQGSASSIFSLVPDSVSVFGCVTPGVTNTLYSRRKTPLWLYGHLFGDYRPADHFAGQAFAEAALRFRFSFVMLPGIDGHAHHFSPFDYRTIGSYRRLDRAVGRLASRLARAGRYDSTLLTLVSDHGHTPVHTHFDLPVYLECIGLRPAYHSLLAARFNPGSVCCVSGNGMAHIYLPGASGFPGPAEPTDVLLLAERLLAHPAVDLAALRSGGRVLVKSSLGEALLSREGKVIFYEPIAGHPFGVALPPSMSEQQSLQLTFGSTYPDGPLQLLQLFDSPRTGDIVVSAAPGFDFRKRFEMQEHRSGHGALHRDHMIAPWLSSAPLRPGPTRTVDVYATVLDWLGVDAPDSSEGASRLL